jgi:SAM-dependent methyltransferase
MSPPMDVHDAVRDLYERFPYPPPADDLTPIIERRARPGWNPRDSFAVYFPARQPSDSLDVLIAGCGTNTAQQHAAYLPAMRFVAIDISEASLAGARAVAERHGLRNIEFVRLPIEDVEQLGRTFDFVSCHGVLHHLADPAAGLRALGRVTRPDGALSLMVYARYGRAGIYMMQELFRDRLGVPLTRDGLQRIQHALTLLPDQHPLRMVHPQLRRPIALEEIADMVMHPRDRAYTTDDVRQLVDEAGLVFHRWLAQAPYSPKVSPLGGARLAHLDRLDAWGQAAAMELFSGVLIKHEFVVAPPGRPRPADLFEGERLWRAMPQRSPYLEVTPADGTVTLTHSRHQVPFRMVFKGTVELSLIKRMDGAADVAAIVSAAIGASEWTGPREAALETVRRLHLADMVDLRAPLGDA